MSDLEELRQAIAKFTQERDWDQFQNEKDLTLPNRLSRLLWATVTKPLFSSSTILQQQADKTFVEPYSTLIVLNYQKS